MINNKKQGELRRLLVFCVAISFVLTFHQSDVRIPTRERRKKLSDVLLVPNFSFLDIFPLGPCIFVDFVEISSVLAKKEK